MSEYWFTFDNGSQRGIPAAVRAATYCPRPIDATKILACRELAALFSALEVGEKFGYFSRILIFVEDDELSAFVAVCFGPSASFATQQPTSCARHNAGPPGLGSAGVSHHTAV